MAARERQVTTLYVEVLPKHEGLIDLLGRFGFSDSGQRTTRDELVLVKRRVATPESSALGPLDHHVAYGPPAISGAGRVFLVPILPIWHRQLFPDAPSEAARVEQLELIPSTEFTTHPWGNALRKAYLSTGPCNQLVPGDTLLFYRSSGPADVTAVGVVEATLRSHDPIEVMTFVGQRTVYTPAEITGMCGSVRGVLAILFRQDRFIDPPWSRAELQGHGVVATWPQSITRVRGGGEQWVNDRLVE